ncbi:unnamed protein product [Coccothraustes coccothraustes]
MPEEREGFQRGKPLPLRFAVGRTSSRDSERSESPRPGEPPRRQIVFIKTGQIVFITIITLCGHSHGSH